MLARALTRKSPRLRAIATAIFGLAVIVSGPAAAEVDCLPVVAKAPVARAAAPHRAKAKSPVRTASAGAVVRKAPPAGSVRKASAHRHVSKPKVRKAVHRGPPKAAALRKIAATPSAPAARTGDHVNASAVAGAGETRAAPLIHKIACPTAPVGPPMSIIPGTVIAAANEMPFDQQLASAAPAVTGTDAAAVTPDAIEESLFPGVPLFPARQPGQSFIFPAGGGGGGGGQPPTQPNEPNPPITNPDNPTNPFTPTTPTDGKPPFVEPFPGTPTVFTPPGSPEPPGGNPPGGNPPGGGGAVPEPATWGLMILGFGLIGSSLRQRRRRARPAIR